MGKVLVAILFLAIGAVLGVAGGVVLAGVGAGIGVATGLSAGVCATVEAAREEGLLTAAEVDRVMARARADLSDAAGEADGEQEIAGTAAACEDVMRRLRAAPAN